jgi:hypothetical protein
MRETLGFVTVFAMPSAANTPPKLIRIISNPRVAPGATILGTFGALLRKNESKTMFISPIVAGAVASFRVVS